MSSKTKNNQELLFGSLSDEVQKVFQLNNINSRRFFREYVISNFFSTTLDSKTILCILKLYLKCNPMSPFIDEQTHSNIFIESILSKIMTDNIYLYFAYAMLYPYIIEDDILMGVVIEFLASNKDRINYIVRYKIVCMLLYEDDNLFSSHDCFSDEENELIEKINLSGPRAVIDGFDEEGNLRVQNTRHYNLCTISISKTQLVVYVLFLYMKSTHELANEIIKMLNNNSSQRDNSQYDSSQRDILHHIVQGIIDYNIQDTLIGTIAFDIKSNELHISRPINLDLVSPDMYEFLLKKTSLTIDTKIAIKSLILYVTSQADLDHFKNKLHPFNELIEIACKQNDLLNMLNNQFFS
jgi:hypothetical protein